uniref:F-box domain-containing protein n=1 Tax=Lactuca sativa TaxID=4236 RepID=A0A9R1XDU5_LACSA|nr:hypothetical protein LSAT_V11C400174330 [Lactuca sativa]
MYFCNRLLPIKEFSIVFLVHSLYDSIMVMTRSMTRNQNRDDDASRKKRFKTCDNSGVTIWSDLNDDVLCLVIMQLGVVDFVAFSGVCKSWRSCALSNKKIFMAFKPPMSMQISNRAYDKECYCYLKDFEGRKYKTLLPHSSGRTCVGLTCGYLVLFGRETKDFWLVNPITRQELHFPDCPLYVDHDPPIIKAILVFSPSISKWIYTINMGCRVYEMRLKPKHKLTLLEIKNFWMPHFLFPEFVSSGENLYVMNQSCEDLYKVHELDFGEMKWVMPEKTIEEYAFFLSNLNDSVAIKLEPCQSQYERYSFFPYTGLKVNLLKSKVYGIGADDLQLPRRKLRHWRALEESFFGEALITRERFIGWIRTR